MDKFFKPTVLLGIGLFSFIMCLISAVLFLTMGILKGLE